MGPGKTIHVYSLLGPSLNISSYYFVNGFLSMNIFVVLSMIIVVLLCLDTVGLVIKSSMIL